MKLKKNNRIKKKDLQLAEEELENFKTEIFTKWKEMWGEQIIENTGVISSI